MNLNGQRMSKLPLFVHTGRGSCATLQLPPLLILTSPHTPTWSLLTLSSLTPSPSLFAQAQSAAMAVALRTQWGAKPGDRVMIVYPPGFDFLVAFLGCIRAREQARYSEGAKYSGCTDLYA